MTEPAPPTLAALRQLQRLLESIHGVEGPPVEEFLVDAAERLRLAPGSSPDEALLVLEGGEELRVGLFLDEAVLQQLALGARAWTQARLSGFCAATEGVSHFLYLVRRAQGGGSVSLLELETQAELDKYLCVLLQLWAVGRRTASGELRRRLFASLKLREGLTAAQAEMYRLASSLAGACARRLEARYVVPGRLEGLLREVRALYRMGGGEKLSAMQAGTFAWAA